MVIIPFSLLHTLLNTVDIISDENQVCSNLFCAFCFETYCFETKPLAPIHIFVRCITNRDSSTSFIPPCSA